MNVKKRHTAAKISSRFTSDMVCHCQAVDSFVIRGTDEMAGL